MIVLRKNDNIVIPDYNDLENKPKINGVTLEGDLTTEDLGINVDDVDLSNYYTKIQSDNRFQPKGSYATIGQLNTVNNNINNKFDDYYDKAEIDEIIAGIEVSGSDIPYVVISNENNQLTSFGNLTDVINASINKTPYLAYLYNNNALPIGKGMYELQHVEYNETTGIGLFRVHIDKGAAHVNLDFNFEKNDNEFVLTTVSQDVIHYAQQNYVDSAMNFITANYATKSAVTTEIGSELSDYNDMIVNTYQPKGNYLTSVPSEYVTETELNDAIAGLGGSDIPTLFIPNALNGYVDMPIIDKIWQAVQNDTPWIVWGYIDIDGSGGYNMIEYAERFEDTNQITFFDDSLISNASKIQRTWWTIDVTTGQFYKFEDIVEVLTSNNTKTINGESILGEGNLTIEGGSGGTTIPTMFIPQGASGTVDLSILTPVVNAIRNNSPWIVWGFMDITQGNYNMVECSSFSGDTITFYDTNLTNAFIRYWTINLNDGTFTRSDNQLNYATKSYVDTQVGNINTILENIIG